MRLIQIYISKHGVLLRTHSSQPPTSCRQLPHLSLFILLLHLSLAFLTACLLSVAMPRGRTNLSGIPSRTKICYCPKCRGRKEVTLKTWNKHNEGYEYHASDVKSTDDTASVSEVGDENSTATSSSEGAESESTEGEEERSVGRSVATPADQVCAPALFY